MNKSQLRISCALRLGSPLCIPHTCVCGTRVDQSGVHGLRKRDREEIAQKTGEPRSTSFLLQAISMAIQRGNAFSVLGTLASQRKLEKSFYF